MEGGGKGKAAIRDGLAGSSTAGTGPLLAPDMPGATEWEVRRFTFLFISLPGAGARMCGFLCASFFILFFRYCGSVWRDLISTAEFSALETTALFLTRGTIFCGLVGLPTLPYLPIRESTRYATLHYTTLHHTTLYHATIPWANNSLLFVGLFCYLVGWNIVFPGVSLWEKGV